MKSSVFAIAIVLVSLVWFCSAEIISQHSSVIGKQFNNCKNLEFNNGRCYCDKVPCDSSGAVGSLSYDMDDDESTLSEADDENTLANIEDYQVKQQVIIEKNKFTGPFNFESAVTADTPGASVYQSIRGDLTGAKGVGKIHISTSIPFGTPQCYQEINFELKDIIMRPKFNNYAVIHLEQSSVSNCERVWNYKLENIRVTENALANIMLCIDRVCYQHCLGTLFTKNNKPHCTNLYTGDTIELGQIRSATLPTSGAKDEKWEEMMKAYTKLDLYVSRWK